MIPRQLKNAGNVRPELWICMLLVLVAFVVYAPVGKFKFQNYDTAKYVYANPYVKQGLTIDGIRWAFTTTYHSNWHPLTWLSHMLDVELYGLEAGRHHLTNVLFHIVNTLLLFWGFHRTTGKLWPSSLVAALFALHPLHVQSVAWVAERKDVMSLFWGLLALGSYVGYARNPGLGRFIPVLIFFSLGLMSKPMLVTLPFLLLLLDYWPLGRFQFGQSRSIDDSQPPIYSKAALIGEKLPLFVLTAVSCMLTVHAQRLGGAIGSMEAFPLDVRLANVPVAYASYIGKMIWPNHLAILYPHPGMPSMWQAMASGLFLLGVTFFAVKYVRSRPWFLVGWLWYLGTLIPVIGLVQVGGQAMADRYAYLPLIGLYIIVAWGLNDLLSRFRYQRAISIVILLLVSLTLMKVSSQEVAYWQNSGTLFGRALEVTRRNYVAHNNLGTYLASQGQIEEAIAHFEKARIISPNYDLPPFNIGLAYASRRQYQKAISYYREALAKNPEFALAYHKIGYALYRVARFDQAVENLEQAVRLNPANAEAYNHLGAALVRLGEIDRAIASFRQALRIRPDYPEARFNLNNAVKAANREAN